VDLATLAAAGPNGLPDAAAAAADAAAAAAEAEAAAEEAAPKPEDVMRAFASAKVRCVVVGWIRSRLGLCLVGWFFSRERGASVQQQQQMRQQRWPRHCKGVLWGLIH
jgi:hypothetical protein